MPWFFSSLPMPGALNGVLRVMTGQRLGCLELLGLLQLLLAAFLVAMVFLLASDCPPWAVRSLIGKLGSKCPAEQDQNSSRVECGGCTGKSPLRRPREAETTQNKSTPVENFNAGHTLASWMVALFRRGTARLPPACRSGRDGQACAILAPRMHLRGCGRHETLARRHQRETPSS